MPLGALEEIYNFRWCAPDLASAGQPRAAQFPLLAQAGFEVVINLALLDADYAIAEEPELVRALGMEFIHIPVIWENPTAQDFQRFCAAMRRCRGRKIFLHCAANMRVSAFLALYRILALGWPRAAALAEIAAIWQPNAQWQIFIEQQLA